MVLVGAVEGSVIILLLCLATLIRLNTFDCGTGHSLYLIFAMEQQQPQQWQQQQQEHNDQDPQAQQQWQLLLNLEQQYLMQLQADD